MKKLIALGLISFSLSASLAEAKFFLGIEGGYEMSRSLPIVSNQGNSYVWGQSRS